MTPLGQSRHTPNSGCQAASSRGPELDRGALAPANVRTSSGKRRPTLTSRDIESASAAPRPAPGGPCFPYRPNGATRRSSRGRTRAGSGPARSVPAQQAERRSDRNQRADAITSPIADVASPGLREPRPGDRDRPGPWREGWGSARRGRQRRRQPPYGRSRPDGCRVPDSTPRRDARTELRRRLCQGGGARGGGGEAARWRSSSPLRQRG